VLLFSCTDHGLVESGNHELNLVGRESGVDRQIDLLLKPDAFRYWALSGITSSHSPLWQQMEREIPHLHFNSFDIQLNQELVMVDS
jgi:acyl CoA:acetate/3-ketoacid CoA transferase alpha subunit